MTPLAAMAAFAIGLAVQLAMPTEPFRKRVIVAMTISALWAIVAVKTGVI